MSVWREVRARSPQWTEPANRVSRATPVPAGLDVSSPDEVLALQSAVGNRATSRLIAGTGPGVGRPFRARSSTKRGRAEDEPESGHSRRKSSRLNVEHDLDKPILTFGPSSYTGVTTQKLDDAQDFSFNQTATLSRPVGAPQSVESYYEFRQEVRDGWEVSTRPSESQAMKTAFVQDGPYRPPYNSEVITNAPGSISFADDPGFSTDRKIPSGRWLNWYKVFFRWKVKRKATGNEWISPAVGHSLEAQYDEGEDVAVEATAAAPNTWIVDLS
jgi:hypothetical protein